MIKTILVATDFSVPAENAAHYGIQLARLIEAKVILCNSYKVPADAPMASRVAWPLLNGEDMQSETEGSLTELIEKLSNKTCHVGTYCPEITFEAIEGDVDRVITNFVKHKKIDLVVMGMAGAGQLIQWALGSNSKTMIDKADFPVLYIPSVSTFRGIRKIAFASSLSKDDLEPLAFLCELASALDAEVIVYHITSPESKGLEEIKRMDHDYHENVLGKIAYKKARYEYLWHADTHEGLRWIRNNSEIDLIALVHSQHTLVEKLVNGSYAHKLSRLTKVPVLIFQHQKV